MRIPETPDEKKNRVEKKNDASRKSEHMKIAVAAVFLVLCVIGITTLNDYGKLEDLQVAARQVIASMTEQKIPDAQTDTSPSPSPQADAPNTPPPFWPPVQSSQTPSVSSDEQNMTQPSGQENQGQDVQTGQNNVETGAQTGEDSGGAGQNQDNAGQDSAGMSQGNTGTEMQQQDGTASQTGQGEQSGNAAETQGNAVETPQPEPMAYTVVKGDTLIDICMRRYGSLEKIEEICHLNGILNADNIQVGQTILLP